MANLILYALATFRISAMLANIGEAGPMGALDKLRDWAGVEIDALGRPMNIRGSFADGLMCVYCNSLWVGGAITLLHAISPRLAFAASLPFALSAVVVLREELRR